MSNGWHFNRACDQWEFWWKGECVEVQTMFWLRSKRLAAAREEQTRHLAD